MTHKQNPIIHYIEKKIKKYLFHSPSRINNDNINFCNFYQPTLHSVFLCFSLIVNLSFSHASSMYSPYDFSCIWILKPPGLSSWFEEHDINSLLSPLFGVMLHASWLLHAPFWSRINSNGACCFLSSFICKKRNPQTTLAIKATQHFNHIQWIFRKRAVSK